MDIVVNNMFDESCSIENTDLDIIVSKPENAIVSLPNGFKITTKFDIRTLQEFVANNYAKGVRWKH